MLEWAKALVIGFLQPYLYKQVGDVLAIVRKRKPKFFTEDGGIKVGPEYTTVFIVAVLKALLEVIQHGSPSTAESTNVDGEG
jgi:hypothetical protein